MPQFVDLKGMLGNEHTAVMGKLTSKPDKLSYDGAVEWIREVRRFIRVNWRRKASDQTGISDLVMSFYEVNSYDPHGEFIESREDNEGEATYLPMEFAPYLEYVIACLPTLGPRTHFKLEFVPQALCWSLTLPGKGMHGYYRLTEQIIDTVDHNFPRFLRGEFIF